MIFIIYISHHSFDGFLSTSDLIIRRLFSRSLPVIIFDRKQTTDYIRGSQLQKTNKQTKNSVVWLQATFPPPPTKKMLLFCPVDISGHLSQVHHLRLLRHDCAASTFSVHCPPLVLSLKSLSSEDEPCWGRTFVMRFDCESSLSSVSVSLLLFVRFFGVRHLLAVTSEPRLKSRQQIWRPSMESPISYSRLDFLQEK